MKRLLTILALLPLLALADFTLDSPSFLGLLERPATPADPILGFTPPVRAWLPMTNLATVATEVSLVPDRTGNWHAAIATNSFRPEATNNGIYFNGTSDLLQFVNSSFPTTPGPAGTTNATTGLCHDPRDDTLLRADFGTNQIVKLNQAGQEISRINTAIGSQHIQGIALVPSTGNIWVMDVIDTTIFQIDATGSTLFSTNVGASYEPNGVCYDAATGRLHILAKDGEILTYNEADFSYIGSVTATTAEADGIWLGTNGNFYVSQDGTGFSASAVLEIDPSDGSTLNTYNLPNLDNIEHGCQLPSGRIYIGVDDDWHNSGTQVDYIARLKSDFTFDDIGRNTTGVTITALIKPAANPTATRFVAFLSDGAANNSVRQGLALGVTSGKMTAIGRKDDGGSSANSTTTPSISTTEYTLVSAVLDYANATASVYTNGVLCSQNTSFFTAGTSTNSVGLLSNIGAGRNTAYFAGEMVHLFFWNQALTAGEIATFKSIIHP